MVDELQDDNGFELLSEGPSHFTRKAPTPAYKVAGVPLRFADQVQLSAVLRSFYGYGQLRTKTDFVDATAWMLFYWRARVKQLYDVDWEPIAGEEPKSRLRNAMACPVAFIMTYNKKGRPCAFTTLCPFCWAREVRRYWLRIEPAFFPYTSKGNKQPRVRTVDTGPVNTSSKDTKSLSFTHSVKDNENSVKSLYDLVYRRFGFLLFREYETRLYDQSVAIPGLVAWLGSRVQGRPFHELHRTPECGELLKAAGPGGGLLESVECRRNTGLDAARHPWIVYVHQLILAADGSQITRDIPRHAKKDFTRHLVIQKPTRRVVVTQLAKTLVYPKFLVDRNTPVEHVVEYLNARRGHRLITTYGCFRVKPGSEESETK